ncbi:MAG: FliG C-terminal domain-containing protein [Roseovarius sp.]|nr:FliG C-terminal domain-containing protein [Roseovarius sp.]
MPGHRPARKGADHLTRQQKAAIIVRFLLNEGAEVPLTDLPEPLQARLTTQMGSMRYVDRSTLADVVAEFAHEIEAMGLVFPRGVSGALSALDGRISPQTAARLRKEAGVRQFGDPWSQVCAAEPERLLPILETESTQVAAVMLSKLEVVRAADLLGRLPGHAARQIALEMSRTESVTPDAVDRIGLSLAAQLHDRPETAFADGPVERVGAILNFSPAITRDDVLVGLDETDEEFAKLVRRAIFTFINIPERLNALDIPKAIREVDQSVLATALKAASDAGDELAAASEFVLSNLSTRMADGLREEMSEMGQIKTQDGEEAMTAVINGIRTLEASGDITLLIPEESGDE